MTPQEYLTYEDRFVSLSLIFIFTLIYFFWVKPHQKREAAIEKAWLDAREAGYNAWLQENAIPHLDNDEN